MEEKSIIVEIPSAKKEGEQYVEGNKVWLTERLIYAASNLEVFELPLIHIDLDISPWNCDTRFFELMKEFKRCQESDLSYPIIMNCRGAIMNGWHRIGKAILEGKPTVKAVRFNCEIYCDYTEKE